MKKAPLVILGTFLGLLLLKVFNLVEFSWWVVTAPLWLFGCWVLVVLMIIGGCVVALKWIDERKKKS